MADEARTRRHVSSSSWKQVALVGVRARIMAEDWLSMLVFGSCDGVGLIATPIKTKFSSDSCDLFEKFPTLEFFFLYVAGLS